ncbi:hypothetical protein RQP46_002209 [Phenoliferia psychrophenolica]
MGKQQSIPIPFVFTNNTEIWLQVDTKIGGRGEFAPGEFTKDEVAPGGTLELIFRRDTSDPREVVVQPWLGEIYQSSFMPGDKHDPQKLFEGLSDKIKGQGIDQFNEAAKEKYKLSMLHGQEQTRVFVDESVWNKNKSKWIFGRPRGDLAYTVTGGYTPANPGRPVFTRATDSPASKL